MKFVLATHNPNKIREMGAILGQFGVEVVSPADVGITVDVEETGTTFAENAAIKAMAVMQASGLPGVSCPLSASSLRATGMLAALVLPWRSMFL